MSNTKKYADAMYNALNVANDITPSVLAVAVVAGIKVNDLVNVLMDDVKVSSYRAEVAHSLQDAFIKKAVEDEKKVNKEK